LPWTGYLRLSWKLSLTTSCFRLSIWPKDHQTVGYLGQFQWPFLLVLLDLTRTCRGILYLNLYKKGIEGEELNLLLNAGF
jgi:hypothetical protein